MIESLLICGIAVSLSILITLCFLLIKQGNSQIATATLCRCSQCNSLISITQKICTDCFVRTHTERRTPAVEKRRVVVAINADEAMMVANEPTLYKDRT